MYNFQPLIFVLFIYYSGSTTIEKPKDFHLSIKSPSQGNLLLTHFSQRTFGVFLRKEYLFSMHFSLVPQMTVFQFYLLKFRLSFIFHFASQQLMVQVFSVPSGQIAFSLCLFILLYSKYLFLCLNAFTW